MVDGVRRPKEQAHAEMATAWVHRLRPDAGEELLLAARAHHVRRWEIPRDAEPRGRPGYLRWKRRLQHHHADVVGRLLVDIGYSPDAVARVQAIVRKERLRSDPDATTLEDALSLVFLQTQLGELAAQLEDDHMVDVLAKTLRKMSPAGRARRPRRGGGRARAGAGGPGGGGRRRVATAPSGVGGRPRRYRTR